MNTRFGVWVIALGVVFATAGAQAATLSIDVGANTTISGAELVGAPGVAEAADNWIDATGPTGAAPPAGTTTVGGVTINWQSNYYGPVANGNANQNEMMMSGLFAMNAASTNGADGTFITVTGLGAEFTGPGYDVHVYFANDTTRTNGVTGFDNASNSVSVETASNDPGNFLTLPGYVLGTNYVVLSGFTGSSFTLTRGPTGGVPQVGGIQIESVPEPASMTLLSLGGLLMWRRRNN